MHLRSARRPQHRATPVLGRRRARLRSLWGASAAVLGGVVIATGAAGGTYAYLNDAADLSTGGTLHAASAELVVTGSPVSFNGLYPTQRIAAPVTVQNTGDVPLQVAAHQIVVSGPSVSAHRLRVAQVANAGACATSIAHGIEGSLATYPTGGILIASLAPGASATLCVVVGMNNDAPSSAQSSTNSFTLTLQGEQS